MGHVLKDLRYTVRKWLATPVLAGAVVVSLALGIGANTTIFTLVNAVFLNPIPVEEPHRLMALSTYDEKQAGGPAGPELPVSHPNFEDFVRQNEVFSHLVAYQTIRLALVAGGEAEQVLGQVVSEGYFEMLGLTPAAGRFFSPEEQRVEGAHPVAVASHGLWQRRFGGDPGVVGRTVTLNSHPFEIAGVAPRGFGGTNLVGTPELWVPLAMRAQVLTGPIARYFDFRRALTLHAVGRLEPGVEPARAEAAMRTIAERLQQEYPDDNAGRSVNLLPLTQANVPAVMRSSVERAGGLLMIVVALVLLIACANVANLLLAQAERRRSEISLRAALGAGRGVLARQLLVEGVVLAAAGCVCGLVLAYWARDLLWGLRPPTLALADPELRFDGTVLAFTVGLSLITGVLCALIPAFQGSRADLISVLRQRGEGGARHGLWSARNLLVIFQVALSMVALVGSGLFLSSLDQARAIDPGFETERLAVVAFNLAAAGYDRDQATQLRRQVLAAAAAVPGVESAALGTRRPLAASMVPMRTVVVEGRDQQDAAGAPLVATEVVAADYFRTLGIALQGGEGFSAVPEEDGEPVAVVNQALARQLWGDGDALGRSFTFFGEPASRRVVGIVADSKLRTLGESPQPIIYLPMEQNPRDQLELFVRTRGDAAAPFAAVLSRLRALAPDLPLTQVSTAPEMIAASLWVPRLGALLLGAFGLLALILATLGLFGVTSYSVSRRTRELALHVAVGAERHQVMILVQRRTLTLVAAGAVVGAVAAALASRSIESLLYGVSGTDPSAFLTALVILVAVAVAASTLPAWRATRVDVQTALKAD